VPDDADRAAEWRARPVKRYRTVQGFIDCFTRQDGAKAGMDASHYGRIFKTLHLLQFLHDGPYRRMIGAQLNVSEPRHQLARKSASATAANSASATARGWRTSSAPWGWCSTPWCGGTRCTSTPPPPACGPTGEEMCARLSPLGFDHVNFLGSYTFPTDPTVEDLRPLRGPRG